MRFLITGGAGFIGSHLSEALLRRGDQVSIIDNLSTGSMRNLKNVRFNPSFQYVIDDVNNRPLMAELIDEADAIFHLAAAVGVRLIVDDPVRTIETNVKCTEVVLELAKKKHKRVMVASTSEVYGKSEEIPFAETGDSVLGPSCKGRWSYAASKLVDEFLALSFWKQYGLPTVVVRLFNTVGPRQTGQYGMVVPRFIGQACRGEPITVYGDGSQSRCFGHVEDVVEGLIGLMETDAALGKVFNLGSCEEVTILELAERVRERVGSASEIARIPYEEAFGEGFEDMPRRVPDLSRAQEAIGYAPKRDLNAILEDVLADLQQDTELPAMRPALSTLEI